MGKKKLKKRSPIIFVLVGIVALVLLVLAINLSKGNSIVSDITKPSEESFEAPGKDWPSEKKVEDYFIEHLRMTPEEAQEIRSKPGVDGKVMLRLRENTTIEALISNLEYYGFVKNKESLRYALENSIDAYEGKQDALKVGDNTVDIWAYYRISEDMTAWEIAEELLNNPTHFGYDQYNYMFMP
jgi:cell division protein YceG involved in septum cleavage